MDTVYSFANRKFRTILRRTIENDFTCMNLIRGARLDTLVVAENESPEDFAARLFSAAIADGQVFNLLGCLLIPVELEDGDWTLKVMRATGDHLRTVVDDVEKRQIQAGIISMVTGFFRSGLASLQTSRTSSSPSGVEAQPNSATGATSTTATGS
jgi:hypothetical protein